MRLQVIAARFAVFSVVWLAGATPGLARVRGAGEPGAPRPNVVFVLVDDLGYGDIGVFYQKQRQAANDRGEPWHYTPHLDTMAGQGIQLRHHYCPAPVCAPSRSSLLLGVHQGHANVRNNQFDKALEDNHTLATVLKGAGYATAAIGKWGVQGTTGSTPAAWAAYPTKRGFDYYFGYVRHGDGHEHYPKEGTYDGAKQVWDMTNEISAALDKCYTSDLFTARAKKWIREHVAGAPAQPFFLYLAYDTPHAVIERPTVAYPSGGGVSGGLQWTGTPGAMINTATGTVDSYTHPDYRNATYDDDNNAGTAEVAWPDVYKRYATAVRRIDDCLGDLMTLFDDLGIANNTFVVFTTDNGPSKESYLPQAYAPNFFNSFGPMDGIKRDCWEGGIRVGALAWWPAGIPAGRISTHPAGFWDWMPTFAELAGVPAPARSDGVSLVPDLTGVGAQRDGRLYIEYYQNESTPSYAEFEPAHRDRRRNQMQALRLGDYLGVRYNITNHADDFEIYNVADDPKEITNLAQRAEFSALQQELKDTVLRVRRPDSSATRPYDNEAVPASGGATGAPGCDWALFAGVFPWVPDTAGLTAAATGTVARPSLSIRPGDTNFAARFSGYISIPVEGDYTFYLAVGGGALLRIHEATVIDADFGYVPGTEVAGTIRLAAGRHPYALTVVQGTNGIPALDWEWSGPGSERAAIPENVFSTEHPLPPGPPVAADDHAATMQDTPIDIDVLANDTDDGTPQPLALSSVTAPVGGAATITNNAVRYVPSAGFLGLDRFDYAVTDGSATDTATVVVDVRFWDSAALWFPFNQTSGVVTAESGGSPIGLLTGFGDPVSPWVAGRYGRGLAFDGIDDHVVVSGFPGILGTTARTVTAWIRTTTNNEAVVGWGTRTAGAKWSFIVESGGRLRQEVESGYAIATTRVDDGVWHHVAIALGAAANVTDATFYVDGAADPISTFSARAVDTTGAVDMTIGKDNQNRHFDGTLDEIRVYARKLSAAEIAAQAAAGRQCEAAWWRRYYGDTTPDWNSDTDGDGANALLEYGMGTQPRVPSPDVRLGLSAAAPFPRATMRRRPTGTHELVYRLEASTNMVGDWTVPTIELSVESVDVDGEPLETVEFGPTNVVNPCFMRAKIVVPDAP